MSPSLAGIFAGNTGSLADRHCENRDAARSGDTRTLLAEASYYPQFAVSVGAAT